MFLINSDLHDLPTILVHYITVFQYIRILIVSYNGPFPLNCFEGMLRKYHILKKKHHIVSERFKFSLKFFLLVCTSVPSESKILKK